MERDYRVTRGAEFFLQRTRIEIENDGRPAVRTRYYRAFHLAALPACSAQSQLETTGVLGVLGVL